MLLLSQTKLGFLVWFAAIKPSGLGGAIHVFFWMNKWLKWTWPSILGVDGNQKIGRQVIEISNLISILLSINVGKNWNHKEKTLFQIFKKNGCKSAQPSFQISHWKPYSSSIGLCSEFIKPLKKYQSWEWKIGSFGSSKKSIVACCWVHYLGHTFSLWTPPKH